MSIRPAFDKQPVVELPTKKVSFPVLPTASINGENQPSLEFANVSNTCILHDNTEREQLKVSTSSPLLSSFVTGTGQHSSTAIRETQAPNIIHTNVLPCAVETPLENNNKITHTNIHGYDKQTISFYLSNINAKTDTAMTHLFNKCHMHHIMSLLETRVTAKQSESLKHTFKNHRRKIFANPAVPSDLGGLAHGGEAISTRSNMSAKPIAQTILKYIAEYTDTDLRICAIYVRLTKLTFLFVNAYFWDSLGPKHPHNHSIFLQIELLNNIIKLPMFLHADFNCLPDELKQSGWPERLRMQVMIPNGPTTKVSATRIIQFCLVHPSIFPLCSAFSFDYTAPWGPHYGLIVHFTATPIHVCANVLCQPKALPMDDFNTKWTSLNDYQQYAKYKHAHLYATNRLHKQKSKSGVAILGKPSQELLADPKFSGSLLMDSLHVGEQFAVASLASEILVMLVCDIPTKVWHKYIGRSQYPKFKYKPIIESYQSNTYYQDHDLNFWGELHSFATHTFQTCINKGTYATPTRIAVDHLIALLGKISENSHRVPEQFSAPNMEILQESQVLPNMYFDKERIYFVSQAAHSQFVHLLPVVVYQKNKQFSEQLRIQLLKGGGTFHKYISRADKEFLTVDFSMVSEAQFGNSPEAFLDTQCEVFGKFWQPTMSENQKSILQQNLKDFRQYAKEHVDASEHTPANYKHAIHKYHKDSTGSDNWSNTMLRKMPDVVISSIADASASAYLNVALPHQSLVSLNPVLGKPGGGIRTICKTPMLYRMYNIVSTAVMSWEAAISDSCPHDTAKKGNSALDAALGRNLLAEVAFWIGQVFGAALNDFHKFFDTIDVSVLMQEAIKCQYPPVDMALALQQHLAPRTIQVSGYSSKLINITHSILAGCRQSVPLTRALLKGEMSRIAELHKRDMSYEEGLVALPKVFVDDTSMACKATDPSQVQSSLVNVLLHFAKSVKRLNLSLSPKAMLSISHPSIAKTLQKELKQYNLHFNLPNSREGARDLGISNTAGIHRPSSIFINRKKSTKNRKTKIKILSKINRLAKVLYSSSAFPAETWGHQAAGMSPSHILSLERDAVSCTGLRVGHCRITALRIFYGAMTTPYARIIREVVVSWFRVFKLNTFQIPIGELKRAWAIARDKFKTTNNNFNNVKGIMSNVIYLLISLKWNPISIDEWYASDGSIWRLSFSESPNSLIRELIRSFNKLECLKASKHRNGLGMQLDVDWNLSLALHRKLKHPSDYPARCALEVNHRSHLAHG